MYCKKCGTRFLSLDYNLCNYCAGFRRHKNSVYWNIHSIMYKMSNKPGFPVGDTSVKISTGCRIADWITKVLRSFHRDNIIIYKNNPEIDKKT